MLAVWVDEVYVGFVYHDKPFEVLCEIGDKLGAHQSSRGRMGINENKGFGLQPA